MLTNFAEIFVPVTFSWFVGSFFVRHKSSITIITLVSPPPSILTFYLRCWWCLFRTSVEGVHVNAAPATAGLKASTDLRFCFSSSSFREGEKENWGQEKIARNMWNELMMGRVLFRGVNIIWNLVGCFYGVVKHLSFLPNERTKKQHIRLVWWHRRPTGSCRRYACSHFTTSNKYVRSVSSYRWQIVIV